MDKEEVRKQLIEVERLAQTSEELMVNSITNLTFANLGGRVKTREDSAIL